MQGVSLRGVSMLLAPLFAYINSNLIGNPFGFWTKP